MIYPKAKDYTGVRSGRLVAVRPGERSSSGRLRWVCKCDCGGEVLVSTSHVGRTMSCGCLPIERTRERSVTHGMSRTPTWSTWSQMRRRCRERDEYAHVSVCDRWQSFDAFLEDMGERPDGKTLDRIDPDGHYSPENCRWADAKQQANNRRNTVYITIEGETKPAGEWADETGVPLPTLKWRHKNGYEGREILEGRR